MTVAFERAARLIESDEYKLLKTLREDNPDYRLAIVRASKKPFEGMPFDFMERYISSHEDSEKNLETFNSLKKNKVTYGEMKKWFLRTYPQFVGLKTRLDWLLVA